MAVAEDEKYKDVEDGKKRVKHERAERARLRHKVAVEKELLKHVKGQAFESLCNFSALDIRYFCSFSTFITHISNNPLFIRKTIYINE